MRFTIINLLVIFLLSVNAFAYQKADVLANDKTPELKIMEDSLKVLGLSMVRDSSYEVRNKAREAFTKLFVEALKLENSFSYPFDSLETISILYPESRDFRIITWQVCEDSHNFHYYGAIQMNSSALKLFPLVDQSKDVELPMREVLDADNWYGALYYNIKEVKHKRKKYYLLFGFDAHGLHQRKKLIDVLSFKNDEPTFGAPIFVTREIEGKAMETRSRFIISYSSSSSVKLNFDPSLGMIVYDNLIPFPSPYDEEGMSMVPDGSYRGLEQRKNLWFPVERLYTQTQEVAPRPNPILDNRKGRTGLLGPGNK